MNYQLENDFLLVEVSTLGAEAIRIYDKRRQFECLWNRDKKHWQRSAPVLFPNIGKYRDNCFKYKNKIYNQSQHGFLRDTGFSLVEKTKDRLVFSAIYNETTLEKYPFKFKVEISYELKDNSLKTSYKVINLGSEVMYFQIGGHPAYNLVGDRKDCYFYFGNIDKLIRSFVELPVGLLGDKKEELVLDNGYLKMDDSLFLNDAVIIERQNIKKISLCDKDKNIFLTFKMDVPLFGLWTPNLEAPFISIEPWYGRCDKVNFSGSIAEREYEQSLNSKEEFIMSYSIEI